jgi:hypothetical protein
MLVKKLSRNIGARFLAEQDSEKELISLLEWVSSRLEKSREFEEYREKLDAAVMELILDWEAENGKLDVRFDTFVTDAAPGDGVLLMVRMTLDDIPIRFVSNWDEAELFAEAFDPFKSSEIEKICQEIGCPPSGIEFLYLTGVDFKDGKTGSYRQLADYI